ncbi:uncharacterized protein LOC144422273 [Styela clava]
MKVIVAGLPKTGTKSMTMALRKLGYTVYDYMENLYYLEGEWELIFKGMVSKELFHKMYDKLDAVVDIPACHFWEDIHKAFPDCKVILTVRDSEELWLKSLLYHMQRLDGLILVRIMQFLEILTNRQTAILFNLSWKYTLGIERTVWRRRSFLDEDLLLMKYRNHNSRVIQNVSTNKLLVFNCKDGWDPLCKFLKKQVPDEPFPHVNIHSDIMDTAPRLPLARQYQKEVACSALLLFLKYSILIYIVYCIISFFTSFI